MSAVGGTVAAGYENGREGAVALALYRRYRPRTFAEVIGQEHVTEPLMQAIRTGRLHHAYLFSGPRGCGKTSSARILARSLNCAKGPTPEPCGECDSCVALAPDGPGSIDVIEIDAASHGGVDDARDLRERAFFAPVASRFKVYIIDEAHMVSPQGFNALLKLVEEPPEYVKFVFATTEPEKVLGTIRSRTHHYPFRLVPPSVLRPYLEKLCHSEGVSVEPAVFPLVVRTGGGSVRDSLSVLDQLIAGAGVYGVTYTRAVELLGVTDVALIDEMADALAAGDGAAAFATVDRLVEAGHDPRRFTGDLLERLRDLIILQRVPDAAGSGIIDAPADQLERMSLQAARMGQASVSRLADIAHNGLTEMRGTTAPRLVLELIIARMLLPAADDSQAALLQRVERMERRLGAAEPAENPAPVRVEPARPSPVRVAEPAAPPPAPAPSAPVVSKPAAEAKLAAEPVGRTAVEPVERPAEKPAEPRTAPDGSLDAAAVRRVWDEVLTVVRRRSQRSWAVVREAMVRDVHGDEIVLVFQHLVHMNMFGAQADLLAEAVREVFGGSWRVRAELGGDEAARGTPSTGNAEPATQPVRADSSDDGWPTTAPLGAGADSSAGADAPAGGAIPAGSPARANNAPTRKAAPPTPAKAAPRAKTPARPAGGARSGGAGPARDDTAAARYEDEDEEPPWDPDYDAGPVAPPPPKESTEEQAIRVLTETLGAERIDR
jgi:DNA polymerase-3 subunit gamma/tau